jgi:hypothetical protein
VAVPARTISIVMTLVVRIFVRLNGPGSAEEKEMSMRAGVRVAVDMVSMPMEHDSVSPAHREIP